MSVYVGPLGIIPILEEYTNDLIPVGKEVKKNDTSNLERYQKMEEIAESRKVNSMAENKK